MSDRYGSKTDSTKFRLALLSGITSALHFMYYNFGRIHQTLRVTPAMEAGLTDHVWSLEEIAALPSVVESVPA